MCSEYHPHFKKNWLRSNILCCLHFLCFFIAGAFLLWKCKYGFANVDESFYLVTPLRLVMGDSLISQEWHLSQTSSIILYPFVYLYTCISGGTEGILLWFRYLCTAVQIISAVFVYFRLCHLTKTGAFITSLCIMIYTPFGIMALSYNSLGILCLSLVLVIYITIKTRRKLQLIITGILLAAAVLCCPYLAILYFIYSLIVFFSSVFCKMAKRRISSVGSNFSFLNWLYVSIGVGICAALFILFLLSRTSIDKILASIPQILNDPEHSPRSMVTLVSEYINAIAGCNGTWSKNIYILFFILLLFEIIEKKHKVIYFIVAILLTVLFLIPFVTTNRYLNYLMYPINIMGLVCIPLTSNKDAHNLFKMIWIPGFIYSFCIHATSNQRFYVISSASAVAFIASVMIIVLTAQELISVQTCKKIRILLRLFVGALLAFQLSSEVILRYQSIFWDSDMSAQTSRFEYGPHKGIYSRESTTSYYSDYVQDIMNRKEYQNADSVLFLSENTWLYLLDMKECSSFSGWTSGITYATIAKLETYYTINEDKLPDMIYAERDYKDYAVLLAEKYNYLAQDTKYGIILTPNM